MDFESCVGEVVKVALPPVILSVVVTEEVGLVEFVEVVLSLDCMLR